MEMFQERKDMKHNSCPSFIKSLLWELLFLENYSCVIGRVLVLYCQNSEAVFKMN